jgi:oligoendopeptidase F
LAADWDGASENLNQLAVHLDSPTRAERERGWHSVMGLWQSIQPQCNEIFVEMLAKRHQMARNAGLEDQRQYAFRTRKRFSYTPDQCYQFHDAIEAAFVPAVARILERKRTLLGYETLRPWEWVPEMGKVVSADTQPLAPFTSESELTQRALDMFHNLDPELGHQFAHMAEGGMLDLMTRQGKAMGAYSYGLPYRQLPFIFMNAVGSSRNVQTMLHEAGHAFHSYSAMRSQPLVWQMRAPMEFNEVASMGMEMLAAPNLTTDRGGFYTAAEAARHRIEHLEKTLLFFPYMAVVDAFQHWVYTHVSAASDPANLDAKYDELAQRFLPGIDWRGYETIRAAGWQRKLHIFRYPFYYIEYGMAQIGAYQVYRNSLDDHTQALANYRAALALGGTLTLPDLFAAAGAEFRFDTPFLSELVAFIEREITQLQTHTQS